VGRALIDVEDLGDAEGLLRNTRYLGTAAPQLLTEPSQLGRFKAWSAFVFSKGTPKVCTTF
jgi:hypothetical protein